MIVPQSMSYATNLVHTDPVYGLFAASIPAMLYSVLGTCRQLSVGPEAALSLITGELIGRMIEEEEHAHGSMNMREKAELTVLLTTIVTFQAGLVTFLYVILTFPPSPPPPSCNPSLLPHLDPLSSPF
jgi:MFS superfamily sulfate permease-like transporter